MKTSLKPRVAADARPLAEMVHDAARRIPPLWPLKNFVAVNPFVGLSDRHFIEAAGLIAQTGHGDMLMPAGFYAGQIDAGRIQATDFEKAMQLAAQNLPAEWAAEIDFVSLAALKMELADGDDRRDEIRLPTFADFLDAQEGGNRSAFIVEEISKWCSAYFDQGQSSWRMPWRQLGLFAAWRAAARLDANPELSGWPDFRRAVAALPEHALEVVGLALRRLRVPETWQADFLHRQLMTLPGWSGHVQYRVREKTMAGQADDSLVQLLAIRLAYDLALFDQAGNDESRRGAWQQQLEDFAAARNQISPALLARYLAQQALECGYQRELLARLRRSSPGNVSTARKTLQAVFCIDVRSEVFRRALEAESDQIETIGFAGFFGMPIEYLKFGQNSGGAHCPVLLTPKIKIREALAAGDPGAENRLRRTLDFRQTVNDTWNAFKTSAISCFSFVETAGLWFGLKLAKDSLGFAPPESTFAAGRAAFGPKIQPESCCAEIHGHNDETGIALPEQIALAAGALKNMGLTAGFAKVVLICGHGSATTNNPYGSALDCGACGGHAGDANARVAAAILNQPPVRAGLKAHGIQVPEDTVFMAGLHNTTTDEVVLYDTDNLSSSQMAGLELIRNWLVAASHRASRERAASLGLGAVPEAELDGQISLRGRDWSQVRPEWGLAGNAAFIAAPRELTRGLDLGGRVFLHNYQAELDPDHATLELILCAPVVVASWINLQYYGSTVDNRLFGSGNKVLHNVVGTFGVWQGNGGDLQPGLPLQSLHDGTKWRHEPLRLSVFVAAEPAAIENILARQPAVRELVENGWVSLFARGASGKHWRRFCGKQFAPAAE